MNKETNTEIAFARIGKDGSKDGSDNSPMLPSSDTVGSEAPVIEFALVGKDGSSDGVVPSTETREVSTNAVEIAFALI